MGPISFLSLPKATLALVPLYRLPSYQDLPTDLPCHFLWLQATGLSLLFFWSLLSPPLKVS